jgi:hypothetical protein
VTEVGKRRAGAPRCDARKYFPACSLMKAALGAQLTGIDACGSALLAIIVVVGNFKIFSRRYRCETLRACVFSMQLNIHVAVGERQRK